MGTVLHKELFEKYNPNVRPVDDSNQAVVVKIILELVKVLAVDEINQTFKTTVNIKLSWLDERLIWNRTAYGGINKLVFPLHGNVWVPDVMNVNAAYLPGEIGQQYAFPIVLWHGKVSVWLRVNLETQCEIRTKKFPLDSQHCSIKFSTFSSADDDITLTTTQTSTELRNYIETAEWKIMENNVTTEFDIVHKSRTLRTIGYNFTLKRTCTSCIVNNLLPVTILAILNMLSFFVPTESPAKLTFPMSVFLTLAVFLTIIMQSLPESVDGISYLGTLVTFQLGLSALTLLLGVITVRLLKEIGDAKIPRCARLIVKIFKPNNTKNEKGKQILTMDAGSNTVLRTGTKSHYHGKTDLDKNIDSVQDVTDAQVENQIDDIKWKNVSDAFNFMIFLILLMAQLIASITFVSLFLM